MTHRYRGGVVAGMSAMESIDHDLLAKAHALPEQLGQAYQQLDLQQAALLPVELARATNGYIDATAPFKLPKGEERQNTVLAVAAEAIRHALIGLLPILPHKAAEGLNQLGIDVQGKTLPQLFGMKLNEGSKLGDGQPLFPKLEGADR
jgi:methionyl-tRNA synthetase